MKLHSFAYFFFHKLKRLNKERLEAVTHAKYSVKCLIFSTKLKGFVTCSTNVHSGS